MKCPFCKEIIDDDSYFCDQCGKELRFCPECGKPKQGNTCPACGADLVSGKEFFTKTSAQATSIPSVLVGNGWSLPLKAGIFGRTQGIYAEFSTQQYISGCHGQFQQQNGQWQVMDLNSHNGTFLNGQRLVPNTWYDLHIGDQLKIATTNFSIQ